MSAFTGNGLNILTDMQNKETKVNENPQEIRPTEIIHKHEITVRLDIDHLLNQIDKNEERINKMFSLSDIE